MRRKTQTMIADKTDSAAVDVFLPSLTIAPNLVSTTGFVYAIEGAFLGNCLSTMANLIAFAMRTGTPVMYPNLMDHAALFGFPDQYLPYAFVPRGGLSVNAGALDALHRTVRAAMDGYYEGYMARLGTVPAEWLSHLGGLAGATIFLRYDMRFSEWEVYEGTVAQCAARGNTVVLPGAYWWQYRTEQGAFAEVIRAALPIAHQDGQQVRASQMAAPEAGLRIGVHVRRGDYKGYRGGEYYWDLEVYVGVMRTLNGLLGGQPHLFVLCSNDDWGVEQLSGLPCCYEQGGTYDDFVALAGCDVVVGPPSTYANWASFLGRGRRLVLTPASLPRLARSGLDLAKELASPTGSGVPGDFWEVP